MVETECKQVRGIRGSVHVESVAVYVVQGMGQLVTIGNIRGYRNHVLLLSQLGRVDSVWSNKEVLPYFISMFWRADWEFALIYCSCSHKRVHVFMFSLTTLASSATRTAGQGLKSRRQCLGTSSEHQNCLQLHLKVINLQITWRLTLPFFVTDVRYTIGFASA